MGTLTRFFSRRLLAPSGGADGAVWLAEADVLPGVAWRAMPGYDLGRYDLSRAQLDLAGD